MDVKEIKYTGFSATPSDYECPDGELAAMLDAVMEDGSIRPIYPSAELFKLSENQYVEFIHKNTGYTHFIVLDSSNNKIYWRTMDDDTLHLIHDFGSTVVNSINGIGNTLVAICGDGMHYFLWKPDDGAYLYLGGEMPECPISFGLKGESKLYSKQKTTDSPDSDPREIGTFTISFDSIDESRIYENFTEENQQKITSQVLAKVNKFINDVATEEGKFIYPFFVRYAYQLYDGSLSHHSAPILMIPSTKGNPLILWKRIYGKGAYKKAELDIFTIVCTLDYQPLLNQEALAKLVLWKDIIKSVDIYISAPIYTYDQSGMCESFKETGNFAGFFVGKFIGNEYSHTEEYPGIVDASGGDREYAGKYYQKWSFSSLYSISYGIDSYPKYCLDLPQFSDAKIANNIKDCHDFYFIRSIPVEDLTTERKDLEIEEDYLKSLVAKEVMTDDYQTHDRLTPTFSYTYNSRFNIANVRRRLFVGYDTASMVCYTNGFIDYGYRTDKDTGEKTVWHYDMMNSQLSLVDTQINTDGREIVVRNTCNSPLSTNIGYYLFYPDTSAKRMILNGTYFPRVVKLEPHTGLNGAFYFDGFKEPSYGGSVPAVTRDPIVDLPNKLYTSQVNNPYYYPLEGIKTIGTGEILGIRSAVKALSPGQFGQFPLYAFCTDGVWSLEVKNDGTFSPGQPATLDVCINSASITQLDSSVLFATARGIMLISGSTSQCISDILDGEQFNISELPNIDKILEAIGMKLQKFDYIDFKDFIAGCRMAYDYIRQRIVVFNPEQPYAYVYSLESKNWGIMSSDFYSCINSYPDAYVMTKDNRLVNLSQYEVIDDDITDNEETGGTDGTGGTGDTGTENGTDEEDKEDEPLIKGVNAVLVTRPIKLDAPDMLKTIASIIQRGKFKKGHVAQVLYGSRDLINWFCMCSSVDHYLRGFRGVPFKYFRLMLICKLDEEETLYGCSVQFETRFLNKLR